MSPRRCHAPVAAAALLAAAATPARASALRVLTLEAGPWPDAVARLQEDTAAQGRTVRVVVEDDSGRRAACGEYALTLDAPGRGAFSVGACDPATGATPLRLEHRAALFGHGDIVARPLAITLSAVETRATQSTGGASHATGGSEVTCSVAVRPFLRDMERGTAVYLTPGRFVLEPAGQGVSAAASREGWTLRASASRASLEVEYRVLDTQRRREEVLHDRAVLACGVAPTGAPTAAPTDAPRVVASGAACGPGTAPLEFGRQLGVLRGQVRTVRAITVAQRSLLRLRLNTNFGGWMSVRDGCNVGASAIGPQSSSGGRLAVVLEPGTSYVVVESTVPTDGEFALFATLNSLDRSAGVPAPPGTLVGPPPLDLQPGTTVAGTNRGGQDLFDVYYADTADRLYRLELTNRSTVRLRLEFDHTRGQGMGLGLLEVRDGALSVRTVRSGPTAMELSQTLLPGTYFVVVDGEPDYLLSATAASPFDGL